MRIKTLHLEPFGDSMGCGHTDGQDFEVSDSLLDDLARAVEDDHYSGNCDDESCDVCRASRDGFTLAAVQLLTGATECPTIAAVYHAHELRADFIGHEAHAAEIAADFARWCEHFATIAIMCDGCGSATFRESPRQYPPDVCSQCGQDIRPAGWAHDARQLGRKAGIAAASWIIDGNSKRELILALLTMMDDGDPQVDYYFPRRPDLSGEWADDSTPASIAEEVSGLDVNANEIEPEQVDEIAGAWEEGVSETFQSEIERILRAAVAP